MGRVRVKSGKKVKERNSRSKLESFLHIIHRGLEEGGLTLQWTLGCGWLECSRQEMKHDLRCNSHPVRIDLWQRKEGLDRR